MTWQKISNVTGFLCAVFMICILPLLFHDGFFDINRFKVRAIYAVIPPLAALFFLTDGRKKPLSLIKKRPVLWLVALLLAVFISAWRTGFDSAALLGHEGRYSGLWFFLASILAAVMIAHTRFCEKTLIGSALFTSGLIAVLGIVNATGIDPLGFYSRMKAGQEHVFVATIGNINFFGAYLTLFLPFAITRFALSRFDCHSAINLFLSLLLILGIWISRTDSAQLGMQLVFLCQLACLGDSLRAMSHVCMLWGASFVLVPLAGALCNLSRFQVVPTGIFGILLDSGLSIPLALCFMAIGIWNLFQAKKGKKAPGKRKTIAAALLLFAFAVSILLAAMFLFTVLYPKAELGGLSNFLRFDDYWGSYRGFVYTRSIRAFQDSSAMDKLFGQGVDLAKRILEPYADRPEILYAGVFNDAHCQPLQLLITCGLCGAAAFLGFYISMIKDAFCRQRDDLESSAYLGMLAGYLPIMLLSVFQPILIAEFFSLCALSLAGNNEAHGVRRSFFNEP